MSLNINTTCIPHYLSIDNKQQTGRQHEFFELFKKFQNI